MNIVSVPIYQLYLLQLENYEVRRYWPLLFRKGYIYPNIPLRKSIVWTQKAKSIFFLALVLYAVLVGTVWFWTSGLLTISSVFIGYMLFPVFYTLANFCVWPVDFLVKQFFIAKAKRVLSSSQTKVIGIAGSYGKTTMKNVLSSVLSEKFTTATTPESVNTPIGIAQWLVKTVTKQTELVIVEYGEHYQGDIAGLCDIFPPDIAVLTGINEAHLERLGSLDASVSAMFEIVGHAKKDARIILNADDDRVMKNYKKFTNEKQVSFYSSNNNPHEDVYISKIIFDEEKLRWVCTVEKVGMVTIPLLGQYVIGDVMASLMIGESLGMTPHELKKGIATLVPVEHRLQPIHGAGGSLIIDDSYNGNPDGVREAIHVLSKFKKRRKIVLTPGLVETGKKAEDVHRQIGRELAGVADLVILIKNNVTEYIARGLKEQKFDESKIIWFNTATDAHKSLSDIIKPNDVILFQNDWGDQYV